MHVGAENLQPCKKRKKVEVFGNLLKHNETLIYQSIQHKHTKQNFRKQEKTSTSLISP